MNKRARCLIGLFLAAASLAWGGVANAALYCYDGSGALCPSTTLALCTGLLSVGDRASGMISVDDTALQPDSIFFFNEVLDFSFCASFVDGIVSSSNAEIARGELFTYSALELTDGYLHIFSPEAAGIPATGLTIDLATGSWLLVIYRDDPDVPTTVGASGYGEFSRVITLPAGLALLPSALLSLGLLRRRRG